VEDQPDGKLRCTQITQELTRICGIRHKTGLCFENDYPLSHQIRPVSADDYASMRHLVRDFLCYGNSPVL
jgi:hypothetical protein